MNSALQALELDPAFSKQHVYSDLFPHGDKNIFSFSLQLLADLPTY
jgi:hypothetical protein